MALFISNAFSLSMLAELSDSPVLLNVREISAENVKEMITNEGFQSAIGHASTAAVASSQLGVEIKPERKQLSLKRGDRLIVHQLLVRLEEGKVLNEQELKEIPAKWMLVEVL